MAYAEATPSDKVSTPPGSDVQWYGVARGVTEPILVTAATWFDARTQAMSHFGMGPSDVWVKRK